jgi:hypothetical protein
MIKSWENKYESITSQKTKKVNLNKMGFNKRILKKENILKNLPNIMVYLDADAIICTDDFSREVYRLFRDGLSKEEILNEINKIK